MIIMSWIDVLKFFTPCEVGLSASYGKQMCGKLLTTKKEIEEGMCRECANERESK